MEEDIEFDENGNPILPDDQPVTPAREEGRGIGVLAPPLPPGLESTIDPSQQGRMYMGPANQLPANFSQMAPGTRIAPPPPVTPPGASVVSPTEQGWINNFNQPSPEQQQAQQMDQQLGPQMQRSKEAVRAALIFQLGQQKNAYADEQQRLYGKSEAEANAMASQKFGPQIVAAGGQKAPPAAPHQQFHVAGKTPGSFDPATGKFTPIPGLAQTGTSESDRLIRKKYALDSSLRGELAKASPDPNKVANYRGMIEATQLEIARQNPGPPMAGYPGSASVAPPTATGTLPPASPTAPMAGTNAPPPASPVRPPVAPPMAQGAKKPPVVRLTKDGKKALFDPDTKAFLGYAP